MASRRDKQLECGSPECTTPIASVIGVADLSIISRHHGQRHTNIIRLVDLMASALSSVSFGRDTPNGMSKTLIFQDGTIKAMILPDLVGGL